MPSIRSKRPGKVIEIGEKLELLSTGQNGQIAGGQERLRSVTPENSLGQECGMKDKESLGCHDRIGLQNSDIPHAAASRSLNCW